VHDVVVFLRRQDRRLFVRVVISNLNEILHLIPPNGGLVDIE
jgi:hypothetical protein